MAKKNQFTTGSSSTQKTKTKKKKSRPKRKLKTPEWMGRFVRFVKDDRTHKVVGAVMVMLSVYLLIAFVSYLFTWQIDQDKVDGKGVFEFVFQSGEVQVENWLGKFGAIISHVMIHNWFGLASFAFVLNLFVIGFRIVSGVALLPIGRMVRLSIVGTVWLSIALGHVSNAQNTFLGGAFGFHTNEWLELSFGSIGALSMILVSAFILVVIFFNPKWKDIVEFFRQHDAELEEEDQETLSEDDMTAVNTITEDQIEEEEPAETIDLDDEEEEEEDTESDEEKEDEDELELELGNEEQLEDEDEPSSAEASEDEEDENDDFQVEVAEEKDQELSEDELNEKVEEFGEYDPKLDLSQYTLPPIDLLEAHGTNNIQVNKQELEDNKNNIIETLGNYNIKISKIKATIGPTVTLYEIVPAPGVRISKIKNLEDDIALSLAALGIRIIAPIPGRGTIGIEVPNSNADIVSMRALIASEKFQNSEMALPVAMGKTISNETFVFDLTKMPHLLMAGATGQGKSVGLNAILSSILYKKHPAQVKFVLVDPKKVELTLYNKIERHFLAKLPDEEEAIITDTSKVVTTLNSLCVEMDDRYELLKEAQVRNIKEYNEKFIARKLNPEKGHRYLPYIVLVVDEFADLIMTAGKEVEQPVARLAQLARAIGIHLIIATQRPSVNIITGTIKANFPARIAFRVTSKVDSRTILDAGGAEQLIGRGDMLLSTGNDLIRIQCGFIDTPEVEKVCNFIGDQRAYPDAHKLPEYHDDSGDGPAGLDDEERDSLFEDAAHILVTHQQGSASLLQRKLKIGYNRAGRIIDQMEAAGIIGPFKGSKAREVLIPDTMSLEQFLNSEDNNETN